MLKNFSQKGFTNNFLQFMKDLERNKLCCLSFLTKVFVEDSDSISISGDGTQTNPLIATLNVSAEAGNTVVINADGIFVPTPSSISAADDGLSLTGTTVKLGQTVGAVGNPAQLIENREIPLNGNILTFKDGTPSHGHIVMPGLLMTDWFGSPDGQPAFISSYGGNMIVGAGNYSAGFEEYSFPIAQVGFLGYLGVQSWAYVQGGNGATHGKFSNGYITAFSGSQVWDGNQNGGNQLVGNILCLFSALNSQSGTATNAYDVYASELNSVGVTTTSPNVINHYAFYAESFIKATNNYGVFINGVQPSYLGSGEFRMGSNTTGGAGSLATFNSTTKAVLFPRMTTTQKNAIASPTAGMVVYDTTLNKLCVRTASTWETITSV